MTLINTEHNTLPPYFLYFHLEDKNSKEKRFFISNLNCDAREFRAVREHRGIENSLHWTLDIAFRENESRTRKNNAPENFV